METCSEMPCSMEAEQEAFLVEHQVKNLEHACTRNEGREIQVGKIAQLVHPDIGRTAEVQLLSGFRKPEALKKLTGFRI